MDINTLSLASAVAAHAAARQQVIAENVAHADTPGYRARDIADFASIVDDTIGAFAARTTRPGHLAFGADARGFDPREQTALGAETPNGNTVSLEDQMLRAAEVRQEHEMAIGVYSKSLEILRASVTRR
ncbi:MAG TPA: FlgB family protein [Amaricoccus sp.]|nr:FlgB family protein [Amaricoccus sp.]